MKRPLTDWACGLIYDGGAILREIGERIGNAIDAGGKFSQRLGGDDDA